MNDNKNGKKSNNEKKINTDRIKLPNINKDNMTFNNINFNFKNVQKPNSGNPNNVKNNLQKNFKNKYYENKDRKRDINTANPLLIVPSKNLSNSPNYNFQYKKRENKSSPKNYANFFENYLHNLHNRIFNIDNNNNIINKSNNNIEQTFKNKKSFATKIKDGLKIKNPKLAQKLDEITINLNFNNIINNQFINKSPNNISPKNLNLHLVDSPSPNLKKQYLKLNSFNKPDNINFSNKKENKGNNIINNNILNNNNTIIKNKNNQNKNINNNNQINNQNNKNNNNNQNNNQNNKNNNNQNNNNNKNNNQTNNQNKNNNQNNNNNLNKKLNFQNNNNKPNLCYKNYYFKDYPNLGHREHMEDFSTIIPNFQNDQSKSFFGIYDGHSGSDAAIHLKNHLHRIFQDYLTQTNNDIKKSLIQSFSKIDNEIINKFNESGATCSIVYIYKDQNTNKKIFYCANVGDSKCFLITDKNIKQISIDHNCNDKNEVDRIKKSGGIVFSGRVFGTLILTRSIGDKEMKKYGVINEPSIFTKEINDNEDKYIILASDGVWDVVNEQDIFNLSKNNYESDEFCKNIIQMSVEGDTRDNVSCIVIKLN